MAHVPALLLQNPASNLLHRDRRHGLLNLAILRRSPGFDCLEQMVQPRQLVHFELFVARLLKRLANDRPILRGWDLQVERAIDGQHRNGELAQCGGGIVTDEEANPG